MYAVERELQAHQIPTKATLFPKQSPYMAVLAFQGTSQQWTCMLFIWLTSPHGDVLRVAGGSAEEANFVMCTKSLKSDFVQVLGLEVLRQQSEDAEKYVDIQASLANESSIKSAINKLLNMPLPPT